MPKYEYEYTVRRVETYRVFVEADNEDEARELAEEKFYSHNEDCEMTGEYVDLELFWTDDDSDEEN